MVQNSLKAVMWSHLQWSRTRSALLVAGNTKAILNGKGMQAGYFSTACLCVCFFLMWMSVAFVSGAFKKICTSQW